MSKRKIINDPVYDGFLSIDDPVILQVIEHPFFQRQRRIKQRLWKRGSERVWLFRIQ